MNRESYNIDEIIYSQDAILTKKLVNNPLFKFTVRKIASLTTKFFIKDLILSSIKVTEKNFSNIYKFAKNFSEKLNIIMPDIYVLKSNDINAFTFGTPDKSFVVLYSKLVDTFSFEELKFVISHELGHIAAGHPQISLLLLPFRLPILLKRINVYTLFRGALLILLRQWDKASEITADRFGLLGSKNKDTAYNALINLNLGMINKPEIDIEEYLKQFDQIKKDLLYKINEFEDYVISSHPNIFRRIIVLNIYADNYDKKNGLTNKEIDKKIKALLAGKHRKIITSEEKFEEFVLKSIIYIAKADNIITKEENAIISKYIMKLKISDKLKNELLNFLVTDININDIKLENSLDEIQLEVLSNIMLDMAISDKVYSPEEDERINEIFEKFSLPKIYLKDRREKLLKKFGKNTSAQAQFESGEMEFT